MATSLLHRCAPPETVSPEEQSLARAFASFTEAAGSLERSYTQLQAEVARLRRELEDTNRDLARSLDENHRMRQHLNRILEGLPCGVLVLEADGHISIANPETQHLLGVAAGEALEDSEQVRSWTCDLLRRIPPGSSEHEYHCRKGALEWVAIRHAQLQAEDGVSSIFILQDISARKRLEREYELLQRRQALAQMSAVLAHEIRNPLGSLELFAGLLAGSELAGEQREWVEHMQAGLRTLAATMNNVLHFHSGAQPEMAPLDLGQWLRSLHHFLRPLAQQAKVHLELVQGLDGVMVAADRHRLEQVLLNLALNAFRFMPGGGVLRISGQRRGKAAGASAEIEVADTGPGIAPENLARVFEAGFTTRPGSPGLGLAVCQTIMQQHGGTITATSRPGRGTKFRLEFPGVNP
ncbi:MAG: PAS sensor protein [Acidobacteriia bacterium]|nr:PAS sensor protein [Terriglobia bacterium]